MLVVIGTYIVFLAIDILFLYLFVRIRRKKKRCTEKVSGRIVDLNSTSDGDRHVGTYPIYEYTVLGETYKARACWSSGRVPHLRETVAVMYDPENPKRSYISGYDDKLFKIREIVYIIAGITFLIGLIGLILI